MTSVRLHLGCGSVAPVGWTNVDGSIGVWFARHPRIKRALAAGRLLPATVRNADWDPSVVRWDLRKALPVADGTVDAVYSSHTLEHLHMHEADQLLREIFRVLRPRGVCRLVVPDPVSIFQDYLRGFPSRKPEEVGRPAMDVLMRRMRVRNERPHTGNAFERTYRVLNEFETHKWMYDEASLIWHMEQAGFREVAAMSLHKSRIEGIEAVELAERVRDGIGIVCEGVKPER